MVGSSLTGEKQPTAGQGEMFLSEYYYVASRRNRLSKMQDNLLLLLLILGIPRQTSESYCFRGVRSTHNIKLCSWNFKRPENKGLQNQLLTIFGGFVMLPSCTKVCDIRVLSVTKGNRIPGTDECLSFQEVKNGQYRFDCRQRSLLC